MQGETQEVAAGVKQGDILAGKFRIDEILGVGGMGVVVAAHHLQLDERVAIKFLLPAALRNAETMARFAREARAAVKIKSEHVARVIDVGTLETGVPYMVMEYLHGRDLAGRLEQDGPLPVELAVRFILQACDAVAEAHSIGIIHRDLKPANLFIIRRRDGSEAVKVLDFGISKVTRTDAPDAAMTKTMAVVGSPFYMSPEQMTSSRNVDHRTDIWALGVTLFESLAGTPPFSGDTLPELCVKVLTASAPSVRSFRADIPEALDAIVSRCLQKDPNARFADIAELASALAPFAPSLTQSAERISRVLHPFPASAVAPAVPFTTTKETTGVSTPKAPGEKSATASSWSQTGREPHARVGFFVASLVGLALVVFVGGGVAAWRWSNRVPSATADEALSATPAPELSASIISVQVDAPPVLQTATSATSAASAPSNAAPAVSMAEPNSPTQRTTASVRGSSSTSPRPPTRPTPASTRPQTDSHAATSLATTPPPATPPSAPPPVAPPPAPQPKKNPLDVQLK